MTIALFIGWTFAVLIVGGVLGSLGMLGYLAWQVVRGAR